MHRYFKKIGDTEYISSWTSKELSNEVIKPTTILIIALLQHYIGNKTRVKFTGSCLKQDKITFTHGKTVDIYIVYEISDSTRGYDDYPVLENCLFGAAKLTKNADIDKYKYYGYDIGFDRLGSFSFPTGGFGCDVIILE